MADEIIEQLWKIKDGLAEEFGCDVRALAAYLVDKQKTEYSDASDVRPLDQIGAQSAETDPNMG
jgi:hypothetical protein